MKTTSPSSHKHRVHIELNRLSSDFGQQFDLEEEKPSVPTSLSSIYHCHFLGLVCVDPGFGHRARSLCWKNTTVDILKTIRLCLCLNVGTVDLLRRFNILRLLQSSSRIIRKREALLLPGVAF